MRFGDKSSPISRKATRALSLPSLPTGYWYPEWAAATVLLAASSKDTILIPGRGYGEPGAYPRRASPVRKRGQTRPSPRPGNMAVVQLGNASYDSQLDLLYIGTGNAEPYNPSYRDGMDSLYTASTLAI